MNSDIKLAQALQALTKEQLLLFFKDLHYLYEEELTDFCKKHKIQYFIHFKDESGQIKKTDDKERKGVVINKVESFLRTGRVPDPTIYNSDVVDNSLTKIDWNEKDKIKYGNYKKSNENLMKLLKKASHGKFKDGANARIVLRELWTKGKAPTVEQFLKIWNEYCEHTKKPRPEWAYLSDLSSGSQIKNWKELRLKKAQKVIDLLDQIPVAG